LRRPEAAQAQAAVERAQAEPEPERELEPGLARAVTAAARAPVVSHPAVATLIRQAL
jgi:hypothetical protein